MRFALRTQQIPAHRDGREAGTGSAGRIVVHRVAHGPDGSRCDGADREIDGMGGKVPDAADGRPSAGQQVAWCRVTGGYFRRAIAEAAYPAQQECEAHDRSSSASTSTEQDEKRTVEILRSRTRSRDRSAPPAAFKKSRHLKQHCSGVDAIRAAAKKGENVKPAQSTRHEQLQNARADGSAGGHLRAVLRRPEW